MSAMKDSLTSKIVSQVMYSFFNMIETKNSWGKKELKTVWDTNVSTVLNVFGSGDKSSAIQHLRKIETAVVSVIESKNSHGKNEVTVAILKAVLDVTIQELS